MAMEQNSPGDAEKKPVFSKGVQPPRGKTGLHYVSRAIWRALCSTKLAVILLLALTFFLIAGSLFPQLPYRAAVDALFREQWLTAAAERFGGLALFYRAVGLFDIYHSPGFYLLLAALTLNTFACTLDRLRRLWKATRRPARCPALLRLPDRASWETTSDTSERVRRALGRRLYRLRAWSEGDITYLYAERNSLARWGTLVTHGGLLLLLAGVLLSMVWGWRVGEVTLPPGEQVAIPTASFLLSGERFEVDRYPDGLPRDYRGQVAIWEGGRQVLRGMVRVNEPLVYRGVGFYLASYGLALRVSATDAQGGPLPLQLPGEETASAGKAVLVFEAGKDEALLIAPEQELALRVAYTATTEQGEPLIAVEGFRYRQVEAGALGREQLLFSGFVPLGKTLQWEDTRFTFAPDRYFVLMAVRDPGFLPVIVAGLLLLVGLVMSFYFPFQRVWVKIPATGETIMAGVADRNREDFSRQFAGLVEEVGGGR
jgi:cytochrome c biogenesis protein